MKKVKWSFYLAVHLIMFSINLSYGQWTGQTSSSDLTSLISRTGIIAVDCYYSAQIRLNSQGTYYGKIGNPQAQVWSLGWGGATSDINSVLSWAVTGNVGVNNLNPWEKLHVDGTIGIGKFSDNPHSGLKIEYTDGGSGTTVFKHQRWGGDFYFKRNGPEGERTQLYFGGAGGHFMDIYNGNNEINIRFNTSGNSFLNGGNVGIGTTNPDAKLAVKGTIHAEEVKVDLNVPGPDYVFEPTYQLPSLTEIENYIKANKHLPEVPSAKEMETNGINLSEMNMLLLKKVEELTLHQIEANKKIELLQNQVLELLQNQKRK